MRHVFVRFLGESSARKKSFRDYLNFSNVTSKPKWKFCQNMRPSWNILWCIVHFQKGLAPKCKIYLPALLFFPHVERHMLEALESIENWPNDRWTWQMGFSWKLHLKKLEQAYRQCNKSETSDQAGQAPEPKARNKNTLRFFFPQL